MRQLSYLAIVSCCFLGLESSAQDIKSLESQLKSAYEGRIVRLATTPAAEGFRLELPGRQKKSIGSGTRVYLRIETLRVKKKELEIAARRVAFYIDQDEHQRQVQGPPERYRLRWDAHNLTEGELQEAVGHALLVRNSLDEDWAGYWERTSRSRRSDQAHTTELGEEAFPGVFKIGDAVSAPVCDFCPAPEYPNEMRTTRTTGLVVLFCVITEAGQAAGIRINKSAGAALDAAAVFALNQWRFKPALRDGQPAPVSMAVEIRFNLY